MRRRCRRGWRGRRGWCCWPPMGVNTEVAEGVDMSRPTVLKWRDRYTRAGIDALVDRPRPGRAPEIDEVAVLAEISPCRVVAAWTTRGGAGQIASRQVRLA